MARRRRGSFADLPADLLARISASFDVQTLWAASAACRQWRETLQPLRQAMALLRWGKRLKHGRGVARPDPDRALEYFLKGAALGSAPAMVDAGLMCWHMGRKEEAKAWYKKAAMLGYPAGQSNLGTCYLEEGEFYKAVKWFCRAAESGYVRAQYNLALCFHRGHGVESDIKNAAKGYLKAAEGGNVRAMYNTSLCYSKGEGLPHDSELAKLWMRRAADCGHGRAQFEHGLELSSAGNTVKALVFLELATRAGESEASLFRDNVSQSLSEDKWAYALLSADKWKPLRGN